MIHIPLRTSIRNPFLWSCPILRYVEFIHGFLHNINSAKRKYEAFGAPGRLAGQPRQNTATGQRALARPEKRRVPCTMACIHEQRAGLVGRPPAPRSSPTGGGAAPPWMSRQGLLSPLPTEKKPDRDCPTEERPAWEYQLPHIKCFRIASLSILGTSSLKFSLSYLLYDYTNNILLCVCV